LWITRSIVEKHGGTIRVKSRTGTEDHGTAFSVFLPLDGKAGDATPGSLAAMGSASSTVN
jgi:signal transduction histidine kinase